MTFAMYDRLGEIAREANADESLRCLVLTGAGDKAFVAGTDIGQFREFRTEQDAVDYEERMEREIGSLAQVRIPTIAAVRGVELLVQVLEGRRDHGLLETIPTHLVIRETTGPAPAP